MSSPENLFYYFYYFLPSFVKTSFLANFGLLPPPHQWLWLLYSHLIWPTGQRNKVHIAIFNVIAIFLCWWPISTFLAILAPFARVVLLMGAPWRPSESTYLLSYIHPVQKIKASSFGDFWGFLRSPNAPFIILKLLPSSSSFFQVSFLNG